MNNRLEYVDMARGIAILFVVAAHLIQTNFSDGMYNHAFWFINSFHMPLFFAISGYITQKVSGPLGGANSVLKFICKKAKALLLPLVVWTLFINYFFLAESWLYPEWTDIILTFTSPGLWFLLTLFEIFVVYSVFSLLNAKWNEENGLLKDAVLLIIVFGFTSLFYIYKTPPYLYTIFFYLGLMIAKHPIIERNAFCQYGFIVAFLLFFIMVGHWCMKPNTMIDDVLKLIVAPCAFIVVMNVCRKYQDTRFSRMTSLWGRYSMEVYVTHWSLLWFLSDRNVELSNTVNNLWIFLISCCLAIPVMYASIGFSKIAECSSMLRMLIFGRRK